MMSAGATWRPGGGGVKTLLLAPDALVGRYLARDEVNMQTGEIYAEAGEELDVAKIEEGMARLGKAI